jgi:hypothetical protein
VALESFAVRTTEFFGELWLHIHAAEQVCKARVGAQRIETSVNFNASDSISQRTVLISFVR